MLLNERFEEEEAMMMEIDELSGEKEKEKEVGVVMMKGKKRCVE